MKTLPDHRAADVDSLSDLSLFNLPRAAGRTLMSMAGNHIYFTNNRLTNMKIQT